MSELCFNKYPILSICIPTYNREVYINELIHSIVLQVSESNRNKIEIVISDNASTDNTAAVVHKWKNKIQIIYKRFDVNRGIDANILSVVELAQGEFCWLLGSDDLVLDNKLDFLLEIIEKNKENQIFVATYSSKISGAKKLFSAFDGGVKKKSFKTYPSHSELGNIWVWVGFISRLIFSKREWQKIEDVNQFLGSQYIHVCKIYSMLRNGSCIMHIQEPIFWARPHNDSIISDIGAFERIRIDVEQYTIIAEHVFGIGDIQTKRVRKAVINKLCFNWAIWMKYYEKLSLYQKAILKIMFKRYKTNYLFWMKVFPVFLLPRKFVKLILNISRFFGKG